jgi:dynein heavy chain 2
MGQGQMEVALELLKQCSNNGEWLCLKNLHLVVSWLPVLEKVLEKSYFFYR